MPLYIARWESLTDTDGEVVHYPLGLERGDQFAAIDLTPPGDAPWRCLFRSPLVLPDVPGRRRLAVGHGERLTTLLRNRLGNDLGITIDDRASFAEVIADILMLHAREDGTRWRGVRPNRGARRTEIWLGGLIWEQPLVEGGATINESFDKADADTLGPDLSWTELQGDIDVTSNQARSTAAGANVARANSDLASGDHYGQVSVVQTDRHGPTLRMDSSATLTFYHCRHDPGGGGAWQLYKFVAGTATLLGTFSQAEPALPYTARAEANGSTIRALQGAVEKISVTDSAIGASGRLRCGIRLFNANGIIDAFEAGDLAALSAIGVSRTLLWHDRAVVLLSRTALFDVRASVGVNRSMLWNLMARVAATRTALWDVWARISLERSVLWNLRARVGLARTALWDVMSGVAVGISRALVWHVRANVAAARTIRFDVRARVAVARVVRWNVTIAVGVARTLLWGVRGRVALARTVLWHVASGIAGRIVELKGRAQSIIELRGRNDT